MNEELLVRLAREIDARPEDVFDAWLDPEALAVFMTPDPAARAVDVRVDARVGGRFSFVLELGETRVPIHGEYRCIDRPRHLTFSWHDPGTLPSSEVRLVFTPLAGERTRMTLEHVGLASQSAQESHDSGWAHIVDALEELARGRAV